MADAKLAAPLLYPGKVLCAGANYYDHMAEMGFPDVKKETQRLFFFFKPPRNAVVGPGATVTMPRGTKKYDWEIELAAVIGKTARYVTAENALSHIAGYTVAIDISARDFNQAPDQFYKFDWVAGKATDTACPMGPWIVPAEALGRRAERRAEALGQRHGEAGPQHQPDDLFGRRADRARLRADDARSGRRGAHRNARRRRRAEGHVPERRATGSMPRSPASARSASRSSRRSELAETAGQIANWRLS